MAILFVFSLLLLLSVPNQYAAYDYFTFVEQWPKSFCYRQIQIGQPACHQPIPNQLTIHGLWPSKFSYSQPSYCVSNNNLSANVIQPLKSQLEREWPDLLGNDFFFWNHEWRKHGTCSLSMFQQYGYFHLALNIKRGADIMGILARAQIVPHQNISYAAKSIVNAISKATLHTPQLSCYQDSHTKVTNLWEIKLCLEPNGASYKNCANPFGSCGKRKMIYWPPT